MLSSNFTLNFFFGCTNAFFCPSVFFRDIRVVVQTQTHFRQRRRQSNRMQITQATTATKVSTLSRHYTIGATQFGATYIFYHHQFFIFFFFALHLLNHTHLHFRVPSVCTQRVKSKKKFSMKSEFFFSFSRMSH